MHRTGAFVQIVWVGFLLVACAGCASWEPLPPAPTVEEIVQWSEQKQPPQDIIERMRAARAVYRLPASELAALKARGVDDAVIDYMQETYVAAARQDAYWRARDAYFGYGWPGYPGLYEPFGPYWQWAPYPYRRW